MTCFNIRMRSRPHSRSGKRPVLQCLGSNSNPDTAFHLAAKSCDPHPSRNEGDVALCLGVSQEQIHPQRESYAFLSPLSHQTTFRSGALFDRPQRAYRSRGSLGASDAGGGRAVGSEVHGLALGDGTGGGVVGSVCLVVHVSLLAAQQQDSAALNI